MAVLIFWEELCSTYNCVWFIFFKPNLCFLRLYSVVVNLTVFKWLEAVDLQKPHAALQTCDCHHIASLLHNPNNSFPSKPFKLWSQVYSLYQLMFCDVCHLEITSLYFLTLLWKSLHDQGNHVFPIIHLKWWHHQWHHHHNFSEVQ